MLKKTLVGVWASGLLSGTLGAGTVALWPIEWDYDNQEYDLRCAVDSAHDLTAMKTLGQKNGVDTLPWNLPPNPDAAADLLFNPVTRSSLYSVKSTGEGYLQGNVGDALRRDKPYTVEGWIKLTAVGGVNATWIVMVNSGDTHLRMTTADGKYYLHVWAQQPSGNAIDKDFAGPGASAEEIADGAWHHWAYTHTPNDGNGQRVYEAFWDGESVGTVTGAAIPAGTYSSDGTFMLGTRGLYGNTIQGAMEYVRISDTVLTPEEFLCAGDEAGSSETVPTSPTVGYWRLGRDANGGVDGRSAVSGGAFMGCCMSDSLVAMSPTMFVARGDQAFDGRPSNATAGLPADNAGSFCSGDGSTASLKIPGLGAALLVSRDFTIETYFRPDHRDETVTGSRFMFGTQSHTQTTTPGWSLLLCTNARTSGSYGRRFRLVAVDTDAAAPGLYWHADITQVVPGWNDEWKHLALVHHASGGENGFGYWAFFVDGILTGTLHDTRQLSDAETSDFYIGRNVSNGGAMGRYDTLRVSGSALTPEQFLCAENGTAATDVLAFFPFDRAPDGAAYSSATDVTGTYGQGISADAIAGKYRVEAVEDAPVVTNPDVSPRRSSYEDITGSLSFYSASRTLGQLGCQDANTLNLFNSTNRSYTIEMYVKRTDGAATGDEQILLGSRELLNSTWPGMWLRMAYGSTGFILSDMSAADSAFKDYKTNVKVTEDAWHHIALTMTESEESGTAYGIWRLYVDGTCAWTSARLVLSTATRGLTGLMIGGRTWSASSWRGNLAHLRISRTALAPSAFLNAEPPAEVAAVTSAYWPLDCTDAGLDLGERIAGRTPFVSETAAGIRERAVLKAVTATVPAESVVNRGAVALANGAVLVAGSAAGRIGDLQQPFTLEGYVKWTGAASRTRQTVCGTYRNGFGWKLELDNTGDTPVFRLFGSGRLPTSSFVNAAFGPLPADCAGNWRHVALSYRPYGTGVWTLSVDGQTVGSVKNDWSVNGLGIRQAALMLGSPETSSAFTGLFDLWRLSSGVRETAHLLYPGLPVPGVTVFIR